MRIFVTAMIAAFAVPAAASPQCTTEPRAKWISESDLRSRAEIAGYKIQVFKVTKGQCYEIYGRDKSGKRIEIYFDPVTGDQVKHS